jgi:hypothetical protein
MTQTIVKLLEEFVLKTHELSKPVFGRHEIIETMKSLLDQIRKDAIRLVLDEPRDSSLRGIVMLLDENIEKTKALLDHTKRLIITDKKIGRFDIPTPVDLREVTKAQTVLSNNIDRIKLIIQERSEILKKEKELVG